MKKHWVWFGLLFLLISCSQTDIAGELTAQSASRYVALYPSQVKPGDVVTAYIYDTDLSKSAYIYTIVGQKIAELASPPSYASLKFTAPSELSLGWQDVKIVVVDADYRNGYGYTGRLQIISAEPAKPECPPDPTAKCPNNGHDGKVPPGQP